MIDEQLITQQTWDSLADWYENNFMDETLYHFSYDLFCERISATNPSILELGCGPGNISKYLLQKRPDFQLTCTDYAENMLKLAKKNCPSALVKKMDVRDLANTDKQYHGIVAGFCVPYLSNIEVEQLLTDASKVLLPDGQLYLSFIVGDYSHSGLKTNRNGQQALQYYYSEAFIREKLLALSFKKIALLPMSFVREGRKPEHQLVMIAGR